MDSLKEQTLLKHPYIGSSQTLIESFLIIGHDTNDVLLSVLKVKPDLIHNKSKQLKIDGPNIVRPKNNLIEEIFQYENEVSIISEITSEKCHSIPDYDEIIRKCFPDKKGTIYLNKKQESPYSYQFFLKTKDGIRTKVGIDKYDTYNFGFVYKFYEYYELEDKTKVCIPKSFCILSQYPYFNYFRIVASEIYKGFNEYYTVVPLEIILYNIINYIPAPVECPLEVTLYPPNSINVIQQKKSIEFPFIKNAKINRLKVSDITLPTPFQNSQNKIYIDSLHPYPTIDIDCILLMASINHLDFIELFLYMFFEIDIIVFSKDIERLSILLHVLAMLDFPFNELKKITILSKEEFCCKLQSNTNDFTFSFGIYGINFQYSDKFSSWKITPNSHVVFDLDSSRNENSKTSPIMLHVSKLEEEKGEKILRLQQNINYAVRKQSKESKEIAPIIIYLVREIEKWNSIFDSIRVNQSIIYSYPSEGNKNYQFQKCFFNFTFNMLYKFYELFYVGNNTLQNGINKGEKQVIFKKELISNSSLSKSDKPLFELLSENLKFINFFSYFEAQVSDNITHIPFIFTEELLYLKAISAFQKIEDVSLQPMNYLQYVKENTEFQFRENKGVRLFQIDFNNFMPYYEKFKHFYYIEGTETKIMNSIFKNKIFQYFVYNTIEVDKEIIFKYLHQLSVIKTIYDIFPSLKLVENSKFCNVVPRKISNSIEKYHKELNQFTIDDLINVCLFLVICLSAEQFDPYYQYYLIQSLKEYSNKPYTRKYLTLLLNSYYSTALNNPTLSEKMYIGFQCVIYYINSNKMLPNEQIWKISELFNSLPKIKEIKKENVDVLTDIDKIVKQHTKEPSLKNEFNFKLKKDYCLDNIYEDDILNVAKYCTKYDTFSVTCAICGKIIIPYLYLSNKKTKQKISVKFISIYQVYNKCQKLMARKYLQNNLDELQFQKKLQKIVANLYVYIIIQNEERNLKKKNQSIINFLTKCLKNEPK